MAKISTWSNVAANNNQAAPGGWPEGMLRADVNNTARQDRASLRAWYEDAEWVERGDTITGFTGTTVVITGDVTASYPVGRAVRNYVAGVPTDGTITASVFAAGSTTLTISGITFGATPTQFEVGVPYNATRRITSGTSYARFLTASGQLFVGGGQTIDNGGLTVTAGGVTVTAGGITTTTVTASGVASLNGGATTTTLSTSGAATLASASVTGAATVGTTLGVTGAASLNGGTTTTTVTASGLVTANSLSVTNAATVGTTLGVTGAITGSSTVQGTRLISTVATGTAPLTVSSTTKVTNLKADNRLSELTSYFESAEVSISGTTTGNIAHGLGAVPVDMDIVIRNKTTEFNYAVGDEISITNDDNVTNIFSAWRNATNVGASYTTAPIVVADKTTGARSGITPANWRFVFRAWR